MTEMSLGQCLYLGVQTNLQFWEYLQWRYSQSVSEDGMSLSRVTRESCDGSATFCLPKDHETSDISVFLREGRGFV